MKTKTKIKAIKALAALIAATDPLNSNRGLKCNYAAIDAAEVLVLELNIDVTNKPKV